MSPILVRPVREQLEHDRIIRLLHGKSRRRYDAGMNPGAEQNAAVGAGATAVYPDLVLYSSERRRLEAIVEVETVESVNHLEALAEWAHFARLRAPFHLYVPAGMVDVARRLCEDNNIPVTEVWSYHTIGDDVRFTLIHRSKEVPASVPVVAPPVRRVAEAVETPNRRKPAPAAVAKRPAGKREVKRSEAKRSATTRPGGSRSTARSAKTASRRKAAPVKKAARPQKRK